jgi:hypothetical protein
LEDVEHARLKVKPFSDAHDAHEDAVITEVPVEHCVVPVASTKQVSGAGQHTGAVPSFWLLPALPEL